ncbi:hypothetical protein CRE_03688 [Caenorhabditis remanei]|uniref:Uncharacterized protein n=1 Tax=Caenorhabditis remanei TaxID=31234 RepID=E3LXQ4_CAERE|nr:hypothetical protein CRE_03688 [Caenorhabditis remanei]
MKNTTSSYDDQSYASGIITTQYTDTTHLEIAGLPKRASYEEDISKTEQNDLSMDKTQSAEESSRLESLKSSTAISISPLRISYEKPRVCSFIHFKTVTHIIAICLIPLILVDTVFIFQSTTFHEDLFRDRDHLCDLAGPVNSMALLFSLCHVAIWFYRRESTLRSTNLTFWVTTLTTGCLSISGFLLWTAPPHYMPRQQIIVPFQYVSFFGSIIALSVATIAVFFEWRASKYAITY